MPRILNGRSLVRNGQFNICWSCGRDSAFDEQKRPVTINFGAQQSPHPESPRRLAWPRTSPFHGGNTGSNPVGDANRKFSGFISCKALKRLELSGFKLFVSGE